LEKDDTTKKVKLTKKKLKKLEKREIKKKFAEWSKLVKERDGFKCVICGETKRLNSHHILPRELREFRFDLMNGISLCPKNHQFSRKNSAHGNSFVFIIWLEKNRPEQFNYLKDKANKYL